MIPSYYNGTEHIPINGTIVTSSDPHYDYEVTRGFYHAFFKEDPSEAETIKTFVNASFLDGRDPHKSGFMTLQPQSLNYRNDLGQIDFLKINAERLDDRSHVKSIKADLYRTRIYWDVLQGGSVAG